MYTQVERCYRIAIPIDGVEMECGVRNYNAGYSSCFVDNISAYERCVMFTVNFQNGPSRDFVIGKTDKGTVWYLDLLDYVTGEVCLDSCIKDVIDEIECSDADYSEEELPLISTAIVQMINDYAYSLRSSVVYNFRPIPSSELPF